MREFVQELLCLMGIDLTVPAVKLQTFWEIDVQYEMLTRSSESADACTRLAESLSKLVLPQLRAYDYTQCPFAIHYNEELILITNTKALAKAKRVARRWALIEAQTSVAVRSENVDSVRAILAGDPASGASIALKTSSGERV